MHKHFPKHIYTLLNEPRMTLLWQATGREWMSPLDRSLHAKQQEKAKKLGPECEEDLVRHSLRYSLTRSLTTTEITFDSN